MNIIIKWIQAHKFKTFFVACLLFILPLVTVHFLYKFDSGIYMIQATWDSCDLLSYIIGFETFIGTLFLGFMALYQNQELKDNSTFYESANVKRPFFIIDKVLIKDDITTTPLLYTSDGYSYTSDTKHKLIVYLKNIGDGIANEVYHSPYSFGIGSFKEKKVPKECILISEITQIQSPRIIFGSNHSDFTLYYKNILGFSYKQTLSFDTSYMVHTTGTPTNWDNDGTPIDYEKIEEHNEYNTTLKLISPQIPLGFLPK